MLITLITILLTTILSLSIVVITLSIILIPIFYRDSDYAFQVRVLKILLVTVPITLMLLNFTIEKSCQDNWEKWEDSSAEMCFHGRKINPNDTLFMKLVWKYLGVDS
jgi:hypothetical protein